MSPRSTYPIILAHGIARFDAGWSRLFDLDNTDDPYLDAFHYFRGIRTMLRSHGFTVYHSSVPWAAGVNERARHLARNVAEVLGRTRADKVNLIAHSMGGLDVRHMLFNDRDDGRLHERVASITTIGTPHRGTAFADRGLAEHGEWIAVMKRLSLNIDGFRDLTREACRAFDTDPAVQAFEEDLQRHVELRAYAGEARVENVFGPLKRPFRIIAAEEGPNDGLVAVASALWRRAALTETWPDTDHLNELAWWDLAQAGTEGLLALTRRVHAYYLDIAEKLPGSG